MSDGNGSRPHGGRRAIVLAAILTALWLGAALGTWLVLGAEATARAATAVAVAMPVVLIWFAALLAQQAAAVARGARMLAAEAERLGRIADSSRLGQAAEPAERPAAPVPMRLPSAPKPAPPAARTGETRSARLEQRQQRLPLQMEEAGERAPVSDLARALDFPESQSDAEGFRALHRALADPRTRQLVQASQDMLTLLAEEGIYMEDLEPDEVPPAIWRRFAAGDRGAPVARLAAIHDRSSRALTVTRMRADPVFRDAAHHFLRLFDRALAQIAPEATDEELSLLADSRTGRAFMLVGSTAGTFE